MGTTGEGTSSGADNSLAADPLWIERAARRLGFVRIAGVLGHDGLAPYLFVGSVVAFDVVALSAVGFLQTGRFLALENPGSWVLAPGWLLAVWITLRLKRRYETALARLPARSDPDVSPTGSDERTWYDGALSWLGVPENPASKADANLESMYSERLAVLVVLTGWCFHLAWWTLDPGAGEMVTEIAGRPVALAKFFGVYPLVYYPIGAEFVSLYVGIHVLTPFKIRRARLVDFTDPHGFAGLQPIGSLLKTSAVSYFLLLALFAVFLTAAEGTGATSAFPLAFLVTGTVVGIALFYAPVYWLHVHMASSRNEKIDAVAREVQHAGTDDEMFPNTHPESDAEIREYTHDYIRLTRIENTKDFPIDLSMLQEVLFAIVLPYFVSILLDAAMVSVASS